MKQAIKAPDSIPLRDILPEEPLLLMGAGPVPIPDAVARANSIVINHLGPYMNRVVDRIKLMGQYVFQTASPKVFGIAGPSSAAMEMAVTNLLWPGRRVLILKNGTFSGRFGEMAEAVGSDVTILEPGMRQSITADMVAKELKKKQYDVVTMVQGETSCGVINHEVREIADVVKKHGALIIVDTVCTLSTMPLHMDAWHLDVVFTGGQKGLSSIPGVSLIAFSTEAWEIIEKRKGRCPHWCLDVRRALQFWQYHHYHYTAPVPGILALHEALRLVCEETLEKRFERHRISSRSLQAGIDAMGMTLFIPEQYRLNSVVAIEIPEGIDSKQARQHMMDAFHVDIAGAFGLPIVRIGQMGEQCRPHNLFRVMYALGVSFRLAGMDLDVKRGMAALEDNLVPDTGHFPA